jgi:hypothetical protein
MLVDEDVDTFREYCLWGNEGCGLLSVAVVVGCDGFGVI